MSLVDEVFSLYYSLGLPYYLYNCITVSKQLILNQLSLLLNKTFSNHHRPLLLIIG